MQPGLRHFPETVWQLIQADFPVDQTNIFSCRIAA